MNNLSLFKDKRVLVAMSLSLLALAEILDTTIVNVALKDIMGSISANRSEGSWIITSYITAAAIGMPLAGIVSRKFGRKKIILISTVLFAASSVMCGFSSSITEIVIFRIIQGCGGAFIPTLCQAYIVDTFTEEERPRVMFYYISAIILGPILGPIIGGSIVEHMSWPWIFYINVPICAFSFTLLLPLMPETKKINIKIDYISFLFLVIGIGGIEYFLNQGDMSGWFNSSIMILSLTAGLLFTVFFIWRGLLGKSVLNFNIFKYRNFVLGCITMFSFTAVIYLVMSYFPLMLENLYNYPSETTGFLTSPRGIAAIACTPLILYLSRKIDARFIIMFGLLVFAFASYLLSGFSPYQGMGHVIIPVILQGIGISSVYSVLILLAYYNFPHHLSDSAGGMYSFSRMLGGSVGAAVGAAFLSRFSQVNWNDMIHSVNEYNNNLTIFFNSLSVHLSKEQTLAVIAKKIYFNSTFISYTNLYLTASGILLILLVLPFIFKKMNKNDIKSFPDSL